MFFFYCDEKQNLCEDTFLWTKFNFLDLLSLYLFICSFFHEIQVSQWIRKRKTTVWNPSCFISKRVLPKQSTTFPTKFSITFCRSFRPTAIWGTVIGSVVVGEMPFTGSPGITDWPSKRPCQTWGSCGKTSWQRSLIYRK